MLNLEQCQEVTTVYFSHKGKAVIAIGIICAATAGLAEMMKAVADRVVPKPEDRDEQE